MKTNNPTYTRISTEIMKDKTLSPTHKLILGYLQTYQQKPDGTPTGNYWYNTQKQLAEELGLSLKTITDAIAFLEGKGLIFQPKKSTIDNKYQYKNRKAIILVDEYNELPTEFIKEKKLPRKRKKAITETLPTQVIEDIQIEEKVADKQEKQCLNINIDELIDYAYYKCATNNFNLETYDEIKGMIKNKKITNKQEIDLQLN